MAQEPQGEILSEESKAGIIKHMNDDHANHILMYCHFLKNRKDVRAAKMISLDLRGFELEAEEGEKIRIDFPTEITSRAQIRKIMVDLVAQVRFRTNYLIGEAQQIKDQEGSL